MPFIPHTEQDIREMLSAIHVENIAQLFDEIPASLIKKDIETLPEGLNELQVTQLMRARAAAIQSGKNFIGAGAYEHHIPAAVWQIVTRGEYYTAYTPYQAEASQGTLQLIYEYQTMMCQLMAMDVSNASLYDGATALAEAALMAVRIHPENIKRIVVPKGVHPHYRHVLKTILTQQDIEIVEIDGGLKEPLTPFAALIIPQPNFLGYLEEVDTLTDWAHAQQALVIALVNPMSTALLKPPGQWGLTGADIACGEGQPLGVPLAGGGPYFGFMTCKKETVRQLPGRVVGKSVDAQNREGFTLTLQAREQHIRRAKATSNICTNQGLVVTAATIYMSLLGAQGLREVASASHTAARKLFEQLTTIKGITSPFSKPFFHEFVIQFQHQTVEHVLDEMAKRGIYAGYSLKDYYPELGESLLVCVTETKTEEDLREYVEKMVELV